MPRLISSLAVVVLSALLASCVSTPVDRDRTSAEPPVRTSAPAAAESSAPDPSIEPAEVVLHADRVEVLAENGGVLETTSLFTARDDLVELLTFAFDAEPTTVPFPGAQESRPGVIHDWGGVALYLADGEWPDFTADVTRLSVTTATLNDVSIATASGISVGSPVELLGNATASTTSDGWAYYRSDPITLPPEALPAHPGAVYISSVSAKADATRVLELGVPATNWGV